MADTCQTTLTENVKINKWTDGAQQIGCFEYCGFYYINMITGNTERPDLGAGTGSYKGGYDLCGLIAQVAKMQIPDAPDAPMPCPVSQKEPEVSEDQKIINSFVNSFMGFVDGITQYDPEAEYSCNDWAIFEGALNKSLIDENSRHPHDKDSWKSYGNIAGILTVMFDELSGHQVTLPYFDACGDEGCVRPYGLGACVVVKTRAKDQLGNPVLDNCGNPVFDELIHTSLVENNITDPVSGSVADPTTWSKGMTACEYFNRPVGADENGNPIKPDGKGCYISCEAPLSPLMWVYTDAQGDIVTVPEGQEPPEGTIKRLTTGGGAATDTNTTYTHSIAGNVLTLTGSDGTTDNVTLPTGTGADGVVTGASVAGNTLTLTRSNGLADVTATLPNVPKCYTNYSAFVEARVPNPGQSNQGDVASTSPIVTNDTASAVYSDNANGVVINKAGWYDADFFSQFYYHPNRPGQETARHDLYKDVAGTETNLITILHNTAWESDSGFNRQTHAQTYIKPVFLEAGAVVKHKISKFPGGGNLNPAIISGSNLRFRLTSLDSYETACPNP